MHGADAQGHHRRTDVMRHCDKNTTSDASTHHDTECTCTTSTSLSESESKSATNTGSTQETYNRHKLTSLGKQWQSCVQRSGDNAGDGGA
jgi:hypothetical protein